MTDSESKAETAAIVLPTRSCLLVISGLGRFNLLEFGLDVECATTASAVDNFVVGWYHHFDLDTQRLVSVDDSGDLV